MDSRYTHHLTSKMENLGLHSEYTGPEEVTLRDGKSIPISRIGSNIISVDSNKYKLDNILHGPASSSNLLSVLQFTKSNNVSAEFFSIFFVIKNLHTKQEVYKRIIEDGLYQLATAASPVCHSVSLSTWHARLGHASFPTVNKVLSFNKLSSVSLQSPRSV